MTAPMTPKSGEPVVYADASVHISDVLHVTRVERDPQIAGMETTAGFSFEVVGKRGGRKAAVWLTDAAVDDLVSQLRGAR